MLEVAAKPEHGTERIGYLVEQWDGWRTSDLNHRKDATSLPNEKYVSKADAMRLLEIDRNAIDRLINMNNLLTKVQSKGKKRLVFVELTGIAKLKHETDKSLASK